MTDNSPGSIPCEMTRLQLIKSLFKRNPSWSEPPDGRISVATLVIRNTGAFTPGGESAEFIQIFRTGESSGMPFTLEVEYGAVFSMSRPVPPEERDFYLHRAFPRLVFPFMREYVAETTRRGGFPPLVINMNVAPEPRDGPSGGETDPVPVLKWIH
jgi:preprotein translocase subunit SecB